MSKDERSEEYTAFEGLTDRLLAVPKTVLKERMDAYRTKALQNDMRPGPRPKAKPVPVKPSVRASRRASRASS